MKRLLGTAGVLLPLLVSAQRPTLQEPPVTAFLTTTGTDTFCLEQYRRTGNVIIGTWVVLHPPGVFVHDYVITLGNDGLPVRYTMRYSVPSAPTPPLLDSLSVVYGRDSANLRFFTRDSSFTRHIPMNEGVPLLGQSFVGVELGLQRMRRMHVDSSTITLHPPSDPDGKMSLAPAWFYAGDSAVVNGIRMHVAPDGSILGLRAGSRTSPRELRRVPPFEMSSLVDGFVKAFAQRPGRPARAPH